MRTRIATSALSRSALQCARSRATSRALLRPIAPRPIPSTSPSSHSEWPSASRSFHRSAASSAEEADMLPFGSEIMNLLENNAEFKGITLKFADRMQKLLDIDVHAGTLPSPVQMMQVAQDEELRQCSMQIAKLLQDSGINLSEDTLKHLWSMLSAKQGNL